MKTKFIPYPEDADSIKMIDGITLIDRAAIAFAESDLTNYNNIRAEILRRLKKSDPKEIKKTVFTHVIHFPAGLEVPEVDPSEWDNVQHIMMAVDDYPDLFKAWMNKDVKSTCLYFGKAGSEFN